MAESSRSAEDVCFQFEKVVSLPELVRFFCSKLPDKCSVIKSATVYPGHFVVVSFENKKDGEAIRKYINSEYKGDRPHGRITTVTDVEMKPMRTALSSTKVHTVKIKSDKIKEAIDCLTQFHVKQYNVTIHIDTTITMASGKPSMEVIDSLTKFAIIEEPTYHSETKIQSTVKGKARNVPLSPTSTNATRNKTQSPSTKRAADSWDQIDRCIIIPSIDKRHMKYIQLHFGKRLEDICSCWDVSITSCEDDTLKFQNSGHGDNVEERLIKAKEEFVQLYKDVQEEDIKSEEISLDKYPFLQVKDLNEIARQVEKRRDVSMSTRTADEGTTKIMFIGKKDDVADVMVFVRDLFEQFNKGSMLETSLEYQPSVSSSAYDGNINSASGGSGYSMNYYNTFPTGVRLSIYVGDIIQETVDVIVNAANGNLDHKAGVALAIARAAGHSS